MFIHQTRLPQKHAILATILLCLAVMLPRFSIQPAMASPYPSVPPADLRAQGPSQALIAFLREGNLWLMNDDGSDQHQLTDYSDRVQDFSWSPSGRYLLIQHGARYREQGNVVSSDAVTDLYDSTSGEMREIARTAEQNWMIASANPPVWAIDADELVQIAFDANDGRTYTLTHLALDGTQARLGSFEEPYICGGPDGPFATVWQLYYEQHGGPWNRNTYEPVIWSSANQVAYISPFCGQARSVDLATGRVVQLPYRPLVDAGGKLLVQGEGAAWATPSLYDPGADTLEPLFEGDAFAAGADGEIFFVRVVEGGPSSFTSRFDDLPGGYTDNMVELWRTDMEAREPALLASMPAFGAGVPRVTGDGSALVFGTVDNPSDMISVDESGAEWFTSELYGEHLKAVHVDLVSGEATVLTDNAILPKPQPAGASVAGTAQPDHEPADLSGTPTQTAATPVTQPVEHSGDGWIAYSGTDGNIRLSRPDGSDQRQVTTDGSPERPYIDPSWSHDGTMLVFSTRDAENESGNDIYLLRDGEVTRVPMVHNCNSAAFMPDDTRLALLCAAERSSSPPDQSLLDTYPPYGFVSVANLDGSDWQVLAPFQLQVDGSDTLWWTMLTAHDISVSPVDGEILVNTIFWSSARTRQLHLIDSEGNQDAIFGAPPDERGRVWGAFGPDGTTILARLCRGCYKDSPGPADSSILLLDRSGNLLETLYSPEPDAVIGSFAHSPDGSQLLVSTTTEETDLDFGTAGLSYTTQVVDIANGTATEVPIDGSGFAWQPVAVDIAVPESTAGLQPTTPFVTAPIIAITCSQFADTFWSSEGIGIDLPEGCAYAIGEEFNVTGPSGESYGTCVITDNGLCGQGIWIPSDVELTLTVDEATLPSGYVVIDGNQKTLTFPSGAINTDAVAWLFVSMPTDAAGQGPVSVGETSPPDVPAEIPSQSSDLRLESGSGWIAYVGDDGNIWLMQPDGSQQTQLTTDSTMENGLPSYTMPAWSPDGTILVFHKANEGIMVYRDGTLTMVPGTAQCEPAAITLDNSRLLYSCARGGAPYEPDPTDDQLQADPGLAAIASSNLDGSDARVLVPYALPDSGRSGIPWVDSGLVGFNGLADLAVNPRTGEILATFGFLHSATAWLVEPDGSPFLTEIPFSDANQDRLGPFVAEFLPVDEQAVALVCEQGCYPSYENQVRSILILNRDGSIAQRLIGSDTMPGLGAFTVSPDATTLIFTASSAEGDASPMLWSMPFGEGPTPLGSGSSPAWQPNAAVTVQHSENSEASGEGIPPSAMAPAEPPSSQPPATVPTDYLATWSGTGTQINPASEWPVTLDITGGPVGSVVGTSDYPEQSCGGNLILQEVTADAIVMTEQLTYGREACTDNGTITLTGIDVIAVSFIWTGTRDDGSPSSASGTLFRPDSATSSGSGTGQPSIAVPPAGAGTPGEIVQLDSYFIGTWQGTGTQTNPPSGWTITFTLTGGQQGEVVGTVDYPTLGCGGELTLVTVYPPDPFLVIDLDEHITYGNSNCLDGGRFRVYSAEGSRHVSFEWTHPDSPSTAEGTMDPVEPGRSAAPPSQAGAVDQVGESPMSASAEGPGTSTAAGPPSIYDDPAAEPVQIGPEGG